MACAPQTADSEILDTEAQMKEAKVALTEESGIADVKADAEPVEVVSNKSIPNVLVSLAWAFLVNTEIWNSNLIPTLQKHVVSGSLFFIVVAMVNLVSPP